ncbi:MAG: CPBP family glutamic-type intramembrane protease [Elusimicrobiota bacterium]
MNGIVGSLRGFLSFCLVLTAPGLAPYQALAQTGRLVRPISGVNPIYSAPMPLAPLAPASVPLLTAPSVPLNRVAAPQASPIVRPAAPVRAAQSLQIGAKSVAAAVQTNQPDAPRAALNEFFDQPTLRDSDDSVQASPEGKPSSPNRNRSLKKPAAGPRWVDYFRPPNDGGPPKSPIKRTLSVGFLAGAIPLAFTWAVTSAALALGYEMHSNYDFPKLLENATLSDIVNLFPKIAIVAPILEELLFRAGLQGLLTKLWEKAKWGSFAVPALISSLIFVALHETADPLLFAVRLATSLVWAYVYQKEGILSSMTAHSVHNGLIFLTVLSSFLNMPWIAIATVPIAAYLAYKANKFLRSQQIKS